jgi:DNA-binding IclR family transcriptional regulator
VEHVSSEETVAHTTRTVERACAVLSAFSAVEPRLSLGDLAARAGLPKATAHRLAASLVAAGFMDHRDGGDYSLGFKLSELGAAASASLDVVSACATVLDALASATGESVLLAEVDWDTLEMTVVDRRVSPQTLSVVPMTGQRMTIPPGALLRALLLGLPEPEVEGVLARLPLPALTRRTQTDRTQLAEEIARSRAVGFVVTEEEYVDGVSGAGVPVLFDRGRPRAAISIVGPTSRVAGQIDQIGKLAVELTATLSPTRTANSRKEPA